MSNQCLHLNVKSPSPRTPEECEEFLKRGDVWVHLRLCDACGHVGCCDSSRNKHATKHFQATEHPLIKSFQPDENWDWCYVDELLFEPFPETAA